MKFNFVEALDGNEQPINLLSDSDRGASFLSLAESYRADDPQTRMRILAENRGIPAERYREINGEIAYQADDGNWYKAEPDGIVQGTKQFGAQMLAHGESIGMGGALAAAGTMVNPLLGLAGAVVGSAGGEGIRKTHANLAYDEPQTVTGNLQDMAYEGVLGGVGEGMGQLMGRYLGRKAVRDIDNYDDIAAGALSEKAIKHGIDLSPAEVTNLRSLINKQALLRDMPDSADIIEDFLKGRNKQVQRAVYNYLNELSTEQTPHFAYKKGINAAEEAREALVKNRAEAAQPFYDAAAGQTADISKVVAQVKNRADIFEGTKVGKTLTNVHKSLMDGESPKSLIGQIDAVKGDMDDLIRAAERDGRKTRVRELMSIKEELLNTLDAASPAYKEGRQTFEAMSAPINQFDASLAGDVVKQGSKAAPNLGKTLFGNTSSPLAVKQARKIIAAHDPKAWDAVVSGHIRNVFEDMAESSIDEAANLGGMFRKKIIGTETKRKMMQNALSKQQYSALMDLMEVLHASGRAMKGQSMTAQRGEMIKELQREAGSNVAELLRPTKIPGNFVQKIQDLRTGKYAEELARIMTDPNGMKQLKEQVRLLKRLSPNEKAFYNAMGTTLALITGNQE